MRQSVAVVNVAGVADHYGWAAVVTVGPDGTVIDRRRVELVDPSLTPSPFHHEGQKLPIDEAVALVHDVERSVATCASAAWDELGADLDVTAVAIRAIPRLPEDVADQIRSYHAQTRADGAMYRRVLAADATRRGWAVHHYDHLRVIGEATEALGLSEEHLAAPRQDLGAPWTADHRRAFAAALLVQHGAAREDRARTGRKGCLAR